MPASFSLSATFASAPGSSRKLTSSDSSVTVLNPA